MSHAIWTDPLRCSMGDEIERFELPGPPPDEVPLTSTLAGFTLNVQRPSLRVLLQVVPASVRTVSLHCIYCTDSEVNSPPRAYKNVWKPSLDFKMLMAFWDFPFPCVLL